MGASLHRLENLYGGVAVNSAAVGMSMALRRLCPDASVAVIPATCSHRALTAVELAGIQPILCDVSPDGSLDVSLVSEICQKADGTVVVFFPPTYKVQQYDLPESVFTISYLPDVLQLGDQADLVVLGLEPIIGTGVVLVHKDRSWEDVFGTKDWWAIDDRLPEVMAQLALKILESKAWGELVSSRQNSVLSEYMIQSEYDTAPYVLSVSPDESAHLFKNGAALPAVSYLPMAVGLDGDFPNAQRIASTAVLIPILASFKDLRTVKDLLDGLKTESCDSSPGDGSGGHAPRASIEFE